MGAVGSTAAGPESHGHATRHGDRLEVGRAGEEAALAAYRRAGFRLVARNWRCAAGEIDLVLLRGHTMVFCEVKTRRGDAFGPPSEAVTWKKQRKLRVLADAFLRSSTSVCRNVRDVRVDVASVTIDGTGRSSLHLFQDAI